MVRVTPLHHYYRTAHLEHVIGEMRRRGAPVIRAHWDEAIGAWLAREGTHRLRAALALGIAPTIAPIPWWRSGAALRSARYAACARAHEFADVNVRR